MRIAIVEWVDSCSDTGWQHKSIMESSAPSKCVSVGVVKETDDCIRVMQSISDSENVCDVITIPACAVKRIRYLKVKE